MDKGLERLPPSCQTDDTRPFGQKPRFLRFSPRNRPFLMLLRNTSRLATIAGMNRTAPKAFTLWWVAVAAFTLICLWPIWSTRFPPLQDYPQHLLQAKIYAGRNDPQLGYQRYFEFHLRPVYATFFAT